MLWRVRNCLLGGGLQYGCIVECEPVFWRPWLAADRPEQEGHADPGVVAGGVPEHPDQDRRGHPRTPGTITGASVPGGGPASGRPSAPDQLRYELVPSDGRQPVVIGRGTPG